jgi:hypothetical protein
MGVSGKADVMRKPTKQERKRLPLSNSRNRQAGNPKRLVQPKRSIQSSAAPDAVGNTEPPLQCSSVGFA